MDVHVPQAGQEERAAQVNDGGAGGRSASGPNLDDAVVIDDHGGVGRHALGHAVDEVGVGEDERHVGTSGRAALYGTSLIRGPVPVSLATQCGT